MKKLALALATTSGSSAAAILLSTITTKIIAVVLGPAGIGLLSLLRQARQTLVTIGSFNAAPGMARGIAARSVPGERSSFVRTALTLLIGGSLAACLATILGADLLANRFMAGSGVSPTLIKLLSLPVGLGILQVYFNGVLQGYRAVGHYSLAQFAIAGTTAAAAWPAAKRAEAGQPEALVVMMTLSALAGIAISWRSLSRVCAEWMPQHLVPLEASLSASRELFAVAGASFAAASGETVTILIARVLVVRHRGVTDAGILDAAWTLSMTYVMLVLSSFGTYYLPTLTAATADARRQLVSSMLRLMALALVPLIVAVIIFKPLLISVLYSHEFLPALGTIRWMLVGDFMKVLSWVLLIPLLAGGRLKTFLIAELAREAAFIGLARLLLTTSYGLEGVGIAFTLTYLAQLAILTVFFAPWTEDGFPRIAATLVRGLAIVLIASAITWDATTVQPISAVLLITTSIGASWLALSTHERVQIRTKLAGLMKR